MASVLMKYFKSKIQMGWSTGLEVVCVFQILMTTPIRVHNGIFIGEVLGRFTCMGVAKMYTCIQLGYVCRASFQGFDAKGSLKIVCKIASSVLSNFRQFSYCLPSPNITGARDFRSLYSSSKGSYRCVYHIVFV